MLWHWKKARGDRFLYEQETDKKWCGEEKTERLEIAETIRRSKGLIFKAVRRGQNVSR